MSTLSPSTPGNVRFSVFGKRSRIGALRRRPGIASKRSARSSLESVDIAQRFVMKMRGDGFRGGAKCDRAQEIRRAGTKSALLRTAEENRRQCRWLADIERADSGGRTELMATERHQIAAQFGNIHRNAADRLRRIEMKNRAGLRGGIGNRAYFLNGTDFGICQREGNQRGIGIDRRGDIVRSATIAPPDRGRPS